MAAVPQQAGWFTHQEWCTILRGMQNTEALVVSMPAEDRYSSLRLIEWWNQSKLKETTVLVVGAGALGNEVIKNLALIGVGRILIADFDHVETPNLARSVLFR